MLQGLPKAAKAASAVALDTRTGERLVAGAESIAYDTAWAADAASLTISAVKLAEEGGAETATTSELFTATADASGVTRLHGLSGGDWWRLSCRICGSGGETLLEYVSGDFSSRKNGLIISFH